MPEPTTWATGPRVILLVDDEEMVTRIIKRHLERSQYQVLAALDGQQGLDLFKQHADQIGVALLDYSLPGGGGQALFHDIRAQRADLPVFILSGFSTDDLAAQFAGAQHIGFLQKPIEMATLAKILEAVLQGTEPAVCQNLIRDPA